MKQKRYELYREDRTQEKPILQEKLGEIDASCRLEAMEWGLEAMEAAGMDIDWQHLTAIEKPATQYTQLQLF